MLTKLLRFFQKKSQELARSKIYRATYIELNRLTDKELNDIGINRGDIMRIAYNHSKGKEDVLV